MEVRFGPGHHRCRGAGGGVGREDVAIRGIRDEAALSKPEWGGNARARASNQHGRREQQAITTTASPTERHGIRGGITG